MVARTPNLAELGPAFNQSERMPSNRPHESQAGSRFRTTLIRVLVVQAVALALLGLLQFVYNI